MDRFHVRAKDSSVLKDSGLVEDIKLDEPDTVTFPVLFDDVVYHCTNVTGGYDGDRHVVQLEQDGYNTGTAPTDVREIELHLSNESWHLIPHRVYSFDDPYTIVVEVDSYSSNPYTFRQSLEANIDKRPTRYYPD